MSLKEILIQKGKTFNLIARWSTTPIIRKPITAISLITGAPRLTVTGHGMPDGNDCAITQVLGMRQINAENSPPSESDYHEGTVIDQDTIELNGVDASGFLPYTGGGFIQFYTPVSLVGQTPRMTIKDRQGGKRFKCTQAGTSGVTKPTVDGADGTVLWVETTLPATKAWVENTAYVLNDVVDPSVLASTSATEAPKNIITITPDVANKKMLISIPAAATAALTWKKGVTDLEMVSGTGEVIKLKMCKGLEEEPDPVRVTGEVTT